MQEGTICLTSFDERLTMQTHTRYLQALLCVAVLLSLGLPMTAHAQSIRWPRADQHSLISPRLAPVFSSSQDIGTVGHGGATIANDDTYRIWGSGNDIWADQDQFQYAWAPLSSDGQVIAEVLTQEDTDDWAKAGIMLRSTLNDDAANVFLALTPAHGVSFK